jgi:hypothetical protein
MYILGWTFHWELKWHVLVIMKLKPPVYEEFIEVLFLIHTNGMLEIRLMYSYWDYNVMRKWLHYIYKVQIIN